MSASQTPSSTLQRARGLLSLTRPMNALVAFAAILCVGIMAGCDPLADPRIAIAGLGAAMIGAWGNVINDMFDVDVDRVNKPQRALASGLVSRNGAAMLAGSCVLVGLTSSITLGLAATLIAAGSALLLFLYSAYLKRLPLVGNITVGLVTGTAFIYGGFAVGRPSIAIIPAGFACLMNIGREILKDIEDIPGDRASGHRTVPIIAGSRTALWLASVVLVVVIAASLHPVVLRTYGDLYLPLVGIVDVLIILAIAVSWKSQTPQALHRASTLLKWGMFVGIAAFAAGSVQ